MIVCFRRRVLLLGWVDPSGDGQPGRLGAVALESARVSSVGGVQGAGPLLEQLCSLAMVDGGRGHEADAGMAMLFVVPLEEALAVSAGFFDTAEAVGEVRAVLQGFELRLREGVIVGDVGTAVGLGHIEVHQQFCHELGSHAGAAVGMDRERAWLDALFGDGLGNQLPGQFGAFTRRDQPADDIAAEDVEDHVQLEAGPFERPFELRDVPTPDLIGSGGQQFGLEVGGVSELIAPFACLAVGGQQAVHGAHRAQIDALVEQGGVDARRRAIGKALAAQHVAQRLPLGMAEGQRRRRSRR